MDEKTLIEQVLAGNHEAFAQLVETYEKPIYNLCLRMCGNTEDAKDLAQESFVKAWRGLRFYKFEAAFSTWLYRLASNVCIDFLRRQKRRPSVSLTVEQDDAETVELEIADSQPVPEEQVLHREVRSEIAAAMNCLEEEFRMILTLRVIEELSYEEIANIMDLKIGTVKSRLARARIKLKKILLRDGNNLFTDSSNLSEGGKRHEL